MDRKKYSIRRHLLGLVLITVIPVLFFCVVLIARVADDRSKEMNANYRASAQSTRVVFDQQILSVISSLKILAEVEDFNPDVIQHFHLRLRRYVENQKVIQSIALVDTRGVQVFNSSASYGHKLSPLKSENYFQEMLQSGEVQVSTLNPTEKTLNIAVPVKLGGSVVYALVATIAPKALPRLLLSQKIPKDWYVQVVDEQNNIVAESGRKLSPEEMKSASVITLKSKVTGWNFNLEISEDKNLYWESISVFVVGGLFLLGLSLGLAILLGRKVSRPLQALSLAAKAVGQGRKIKSLKTSLQEASDIEDALVIAANERDNNEKIMRVLYEKEQETVKIRDTFLSVASHELKTPITTLKLQLQLLNRNIKKNEFTPRQEMEKPISRLENQVSRLVSLVDDLLDVSKINAGKINFHHEYFDLVPFINELAGQLEGLAQESQSPITIKGETSIMGMWDRHRLEQIMINLMSNAIKYGDHKPIEVNLHNHEFGAIITVKDNGIGISEQDQQRIFERFERAVTGNSISGLGLGLWIVKKIVDGLGGEITVESKIGSGSIFTLKLPKEPPVKSAGESTSTLDFTQTY